MKVAVFLSLAALALATSAPVLGAETYTAVPAGTAGPGLYLDRVGPLFEGSDNFPIVERLPRIARQPLWAVYAIGEPITGGCRLYDEEGDLVRGSSLLVELYRLTFYRQKAYYELVFRQRFGYDGASGRHQFSIPTDGLDAAYYQVRVAIPKSNELDPEFRIQIGDAVFTNDVPPPGVDPDCGCGG